MDAKNNKGKKPLYYFRAGNHGELLDSLAIDLQSECKRRDIDADDKLQKKRKSDTHNSQLLSIEVNQFGCSKGSISRL